MISSIQHVNIRCEDATAACAFYVALGLVDGDRPPFASAGHWLYAGADPMVHLVQRGTGEPQPERSTGAFDHVAFTATDLDGTRAMLDERGIPYRETLVPRDNVVQLILTDPDGVKIELNFAQA